MKAIYKNILTKNNQYIEYNLNSLIILEIWKKLFRPTPAPEFTQNFFLKRSRRSFMRIFITTAP